MHGVFLHCWCMVLFILLDLIEYVDAMVFVRYFNGDLLGESDGKISAVISSVCSRERSVP